jgi:hypothetical protein
MGQFIKWTAITAAIVTGASFVYAAARAARRKLDEGLRRADEMAEDAQRVLASTRQAVADAQQTVRHLRATVS